MLQKINNVHQLPEELCISCGMCQGVCPQKCIAMKRNEYGQYIPHIKNDICISCGKCYAICPGRGTDLQKISKKIYNLELNDIFAGNYYNVASYIARDTKQLKQSTSGGIVTTIVKKLLDESFYSVAFLVDTYNYETYIQVHPYKKGDSLENTTKSRYVPVSQANMVRYCLEHPNEKVIVVGTGCVVESFHKILLQNGLDRTNYFIIGLFCNATMNYNIWNYFNKKANNNLSKLYFRSKENNNYFYGIVKMVNTDGTMHYMEPGKRMLLKPYLTMERCIYCIDKLNVLADISVGDGNTRNGNGSSSSVIVRTPAGREIMERYKELFDMKPSDMVSIEKSQNIELTYQQLRFSKLYYDKCKFDILDGMQLDQMISDNDRRIWKKRIRRHHFGSKNKNFVVFYCWMEIKWKIVETIRIIRNIKKNVMK